MKRYDVVVIGSGIAGLSFALEAAKYGSVAIITKKARGESNTTYAQGGVACVSSDDDSFDLHVEDTLTTGAGLSDEEVVRTIVSEGPARIRELIELGVRFDGEETLLTAGIPIEPQADAPRVVGTREVERADPAINQVPAAPNGRGNTTAMPAWLPKFALAREGGHSRRRILHARDATGHEIEWALLRALADTPAIDLYENHMAVDLITTSRLGLPGDDRCVGAYILDEATGEVLTFRTDQLVLATGGCGRVYLYTTNPGVATGDGVAMAWRAGVSIANMEFIQFHPTCLFHPAARSFLISEAVRGEGGRLVDGEGRAFMAEYHHLADLAPRDVVARAIDAEMKRTGAQCVYLDIRDQPAEFVRNRFPTIYQKCLSLGIDITRDPIPVVPAAHYQCGGILTDLDGATSLPGLSAIGEVACTGLHGANRLASNSLLEAVVIAHRAAEAVGRALARTRTTVRLGPEANGCGPESRDPVVMPEWRSGSATEIDELVVIYHPWDEIRRLMWDYVGIVRTDRRLRRAQARLRDLRHEIQEQYWNFRLSTDLLELRNLADLAALIVESALMRKESRGLHFTLDYPDQDEGARHNTIIRRGHTEVRV